MIGRVVVTGGSGRLGRSVVDVLHAQGHHVISMDRIARDLLPDGVEEVIIDIAQPGAFAQALERVAADTIVHLAAIAVPFSAPDDVIFATNVGIARIVLDAAAETGTRRVLVASSPTVLGYGDPSGWTPDYLPLDEAHPVRPWNGYARSKVEIERMVQDRAQAQPDIRYGAFRPCYVIAPEEWLGSPTQQGHTVRERLEDPSLASIALFNYVDARDAGEFVAAWIAHAHEIENGGVYFVSAQDALAREPIGPLLAKVLPAAAAAAGTLPDGAAAFSAGKAHRELGWTARRSWRTELPESAARR